MTMVLPTEFQLKVQLFRRYRAALPELQPLLVVLKAMLRERGFNKVLFAQLLMLRNFLAITWLVLQTCCIGLRSA
jgi:hypothetical protein